jgi:DNA-binding protein HU-beta
MIKSDIVNKIAEETGLTKAQSTDALNAFLGAVSNALKSGDKVSILGFGTFAPVERPERESRNPRTGDKFMSPAKRVVKFKPGKELDESVNA